MPQEQSRAEDGRPSLSENSEQAVHHSAGTGAWVVALATLAGCAPTVNVFGVYFPAWLVSAIVGLVVAYVVVWRLGRRPHSRALAQSGLLFCSLTIMVGLMMWWIFFSSS